MQGEFLKIQEISFPMNTKTSDFRQKMSEETVVKDAYSAQKIKKAVI